MKSLLAMVVVVLLALPVGFASEERAAAGIHNPEGLSLATLFFHLNGFSDLPLNTQEPNGTYQGGSQGLGTNSLSCVGEGTGQPLLEAEYHTNYAYASPARVDYDANENGEPRIHPERGISWDLKWDQATGVDLYWYLETGLLTESLVGTPAVVPNVVVAATIRAGDSISVNNIAYNSGPLLASGRSEPQQLVPVAAVNPNYFPRDDGGAAYEFRIPMTIVEGNVPSETGFNVRIDAFVDLPNCSNPEDRYLMPNLVGSHSSAGHRPRMEILAADPLRIQYLHPQFIGGELVLHTAVNSVWGNYDVDIESLNMTITGPTAPTANNFFRLLVTPRNHIYGAPTLPVDVAYVWNYTADGAQAGTYRVDFEAWNVQHTAKATATTYFDPGSMTAISCGEADVRPDEEYTTVCAGTLEDSSAKMPGFGLVAALACVAAAVLLLRRRA